LQSHHDRDTASAGVAHELGQVAPPNATMRSTSLSFKVQVGPPQIAIHQGQTVLVTGLDGQIMWPSEKGLYFHDTRIISNWAIYANGEPWELLLNGGPISYYIGRQPQAENAPGSCCYW
jgi:hypothetical protein